MNKFYRFLHCVGLKNFVLNSTKSMGEGIEAAFYLFIYLFIFFV